MAQNKLVLSDEYHNINRAGGCHQNVTLSKVFGIIVTAALTFTIAMTIILSNKWTPKILCGTGCLDMTNEDKSKMPATASYVAFDSSAPGFKQRLPSAIIIGTRKSGTKALLDFIGLNHGVVTADKEVNFFDKNYDRGLEWYRHKMPLSFSDQITAEKTPSYFTTLEVRERIHRYNASIKLLIIVRNPIDRSISDYLQMKINGKHPAETNNRSFEDYVIDKDTGRLNETKGCLNRSLYVVLLTKWLEYFPLKQILIVSGEDIKIKPWEEIARVQRFLGLPEDINKSNFIYNETKGFFCTRSKFDKFTVLSTRSSFFYDNISKTQYVETCLSENKGREHPVVDPKVRLQLGKFFKPYNEQFFAMIGRRFNWS